MLGPIGAKRVIKISQKIKKKMAENCLIIFKLNCLGVLELVGALYFNGMVCIFRVKKDLKVLFLQDCISMLQNRTGYLLVACNEIAYILNSDCQF